MSLIKHRSSLASKLTCKTQLVFVVWGRINVMAEKQCDGEGDVTKSTNGIDALFFQQYVYKREINETVNSVFSLNWFFFA